MLGVLLITGLFVLFVEKRKITVPILYNPLKNTLFGLALGCAWIGAAVLVLVLTGSLHFTGRHEIPYLAVWFIAVLLNVIMQEYLIRGYLFSLLKEKYNVFVAIIVTTIFFTIIHGGAFEAGIVAVMNVITMSIFVSMLLVLTKSLLAPIIVHFIWNSVGQLIFGIVPLADDYPCLMDGTLSGNIMISGGYAKLEGSIIVLIVNVPMEEILMKRVHTKAEPAFKAVEAGSAGFVIKRGNSDF